MCFVQLMIALSFQKWATANWLYAFHRAADVLSGRADQYGFGNRWPRAQVWNDPPKYRSDSEFLSTLTGADLDVRAATFADAPEVLFEWPEPPGVKHGSRESGKN